MERQSVVRIGQISRLIHIRVSHKKKQNAMKIGRMNKPTQLTVIQHETSTDEEVIEVKMAMSRLKQI